MPKVALILEKTRNSVKNMLNRKNSLFWLLIALMVVLVLVGLILLANSLSLDNPGDLATLDGFKTAIKWQLGSIADITGSEKEKHFGKITEQQRILQYQEEIIWIELAVDRPVEEIVKERFSIINNPLIDFASPVHLYVKANLIVEYSGHDEKVLNALVKLLGTELPHDVPYSK